ncbi:ArsR/SmtB family transcription factor [Halosegnis marinus]|uniref:ArsR/SmtB family transcription factor n=1 Tax=Halosegnis marinus TaxID=3034023 RepID=A0ABD5ZND4_9EURY|nr:winged helix-turn-helix domain-containing protein [Halosegnis sp. DT85]
MSLLPSTPDVSADGDPRVVGVDSEDADELLAALSSKTARRILAALHDEPAPPSRIADSVDSSLQNVQYHLSNLDDAGVVEVVGTAYSEKGREMDVYAPADQPLVIVAAEEEQASGLRAALSRFLGGVAALVVGSAAVQQLYGGGVLPSMGSGAPIEQGGDAGGAPVTDTAAEETATAAPTTTPTATDGGIGIAEVTDTATATATRAATETPEPTRTAVETVATGGDAVGTLPPGALFFLGGFVVLVAAVALSVR